MTSAGHGDPFRALLDVGAALVSSSAFDDALQNVAAAIGTAMRVATVDIQSWDRANGRLVEEAYWSAGGVSDEDGEVIGSSIRLADHPTAGDVLEACRTVELRADDPGLPAAARDALAGWGLTTTLDGPLVIGDEVIGLLGVAEARFARRFLTMEVKLFEQLSGMAAAAMHNARLARRERRSSRHLEVLLDLSARLSTGADPVALAGAAADTLADVLAAPFAGVYECDDAGRLSARAGSPAGAPAEGERAAVATAITGALLADAGYDSKRAADAGGAGTGDDATVLVSTVTAGIDDDIPVGMPALGEVTRLTLVTLRRERPVAVLSAAWPESRGLDADDLDLVRAVGDLVALAFDNARLAQG